MPRDPFEEFSRSLERHLDGEPPIYPEALVKLIDAMREYIRSDITLAAELLHEDAITREQYDNGIAELAPLITWLKKYEDSETCPNLFGLIKEGKR